MLNVIDLFSGVGGLSTGFTDAGTNVVFANEIDESIAEAYKVNHPNVKVGWDAWAPTLTGLSSEEIRQSILKLKPYIIKMWKLGGKVFFKHILMV